MNSTLAQAEAQEPRVARALAAGRRAALTVLRRQDLINLIAQLGPSASSAIINLVRPRLLQPLNVIMDAFWEAGRGVAEQGVAVAQPTVRKRDLSFFFDEYDPNTEAAAREFRNTLITNMDQALRDTLQLVIATGIGAGLGPPEIANNIRATIGLTPRQAAAVLRYRQRLESGEVPEVVAGSNMLTGEDRAKIKNGRPLPSAKIDRLVEYYADLQASQRAATIARTETLRAVNKGQDTAMRQAQATGAFGDLEVRRFWLATADSKTRPEHREIARLNPQGVGLDELFRYPGGRTIALPGDPWAEAEMTINCRCTVVHRLFPRKK